MHRILFTVIHSHTRLLPMMAAEGGMMIDCVQGVGATTEQRRDRGETRIQIFHRLNEEQTCTIQDGKEERLSSADERQRGGGVIHCHTAVLQGVEKPVLLFIFFSSKRMKRFFWSQKGLLSFLGSLSGRDVISINYLPHQRDRNMLAPFCFSHLIALFTEQLPMDNNMHTHSDMHAGQEADTSQIGHERYTELSAKQRWIHCCWGGVWGPCWTENPQEKWDIAFMTFSCYKEKTVVPNRRKTAAVKIPFIFKTSCLKHTCCIMRICVLFLTV